MRSESAAAAFATPTVVAGRAVGPGSLFLTFGQAFGVPTVTPPTLTSDFLD